MFTKQTMTHITSFLQKTFDSCSIILPLSRISHSLVKVAKANSYIETLGDNADTLHLWIKKSYEEDFKASFEIQVQKALKHLRATTARLAFDTTNEPFYGKTRSLYIFNTSNEYSYDGEFKFISVCLITRNKQIPLMAIPMIVGVGNAKPTIELLEYCQTLFKKIRLAVFDRGFYIAELIDYLESKKIKYLILVPERKGVITTYVEETFELGKFKHEMIYSKNKSKWKPKTTIVVCKGISKFSWIFATNIQFKTRVEYIWYYKKRWQIETNYRVEDEAKIKSKSSNHLIRYFYFLISLLLHLMWIVNKNLKYYAPFKKYLDIIEHELLFKYLEIVNV
ncbi:MAG: transposase [Nanoarchaeota archaeon]|nr:transposase [Nanoarchaeota archaeon]MBU1604574.1 transposase [Nanoarchaeota archaeon]